MSRKYDMRICKCGRIHMIENNVIEKALQNNKNILLICAGCGNATLIGADSILDGSGKTEYMMYSCEFARYKDRTIEISDFEPSEHDKGIYKIIYSQGYRVPMMTGMYATDYCNGKFSDRWHPDFYEIQKRDITVEEIMKFIKKYNHDRTMVNIRRFINETPQEILKEISHYYIESFNWRGTKFENKINTFN